MTADADCQACAETGGCAWHTVTEAELVADGFLPPPLPTPPETTDA